MADYRDINRANWDERAPAHAASPDYRVQRFADDPAFLSSVVRFDRDRLGDITGRRGVHLQCHIGTDTVSLARLGARMTGLDFSPVSLTQARNIAALAHADIDFVQADLYDAVDALGGPGRFELVYTGIGALCWLPDVRRWAAVVNALLRPGGRLFIREGHPVLWSLDERITDRLQIVFAYFETPNALIWEEDGTYVETDTQFQHNVSHSWNHGLGEIITALLAEGLMLTQFVEHDSVPWEALPGQMHQGANQEWYLTDRPERLPLSYTLQAVKPT
jgi:SAM-dependent methyltransferase